MPASNWDNSRPCCVMTWSTLAILGEHSKPFPTAGTIKMKQLLFWAGSPGTRKARARVLAVQMDSVLRDLFGSKYEKDVDQGVAVLGLAKALLDEAGKGNSTMLDLAEADDRLYFFMGET